MSQGFFKRRKSRRHCPRSAIVPASRGINAEHRDAKRDRYPRARKFTGLRRAVQLTEQYLLLHVMRVHHRSGAIPRRNGGQ